MEGQVTLVAGVIPCEIFSNMPFLYLEKLNVQNHDLSVCILFRDISCGETAANRKICKAVCVLEGPNLVTPQLLTCRVIGAFQNANGLTDFSACSCFPTTYIPKSYTDR